MPTYVWLIIVGVVLLIWWLWSKYGSTYMALSGNGDLLHGIGSVERYVTDIEGLIGAFDSASDSQGSFMSRLGAFFGKLPT
jgi:DNA-binding transcriptional regulator of glucitol operon